MADDMAGWGVLVTGAQQGIGRAVALRFAGCGANVAVNHPDDDDAAEAVCGEIRALGCRAVPIRADVSDTRACAALAGAAEAALGRLDVLVNNAGVFPRVPFLDMEDAQWDTVLNTNLRGSAFCAQAAARRMAAAGRGGAIVNLCSAAVRGAPLGVHYGASKAGIVGLTRSMALALAPHGIRVNAVAPGLTDTAQPRHGNTEAELADMARAIPLGRMGRPEEVADTVLFLASPRAGWTTGQVYHLNGGTYLA